jgi:hypothetical protein
MIILCQDDNSDRDGFDDVDEVWWEEARTRKAGGYCAKAH